MFGYSDFCLSEILVGSGKKLLSPGLLPLQSPISTRTCGSCSRVRGRSQEKGVFSL